MNVSVNIAVCVQSCSWSMCVHACSCNAAQMLLSDSCVNKCSDIRKAVCNMLNVAAYLLVSEYRLVG